MPKIIQREVSAAETMQALMRGIDNIYNAGLAPGEKKVGFVVLMFPYGATDGQANNISNGASRKDIIAFLKETAARLEGRVSDHVGRA